MDGENESDYVERTLRLFESFIFEMVGDRPFGSGLMHFLAVLGIDADMGRLRVANAYSPIFAGVAYCIRVIGAEALLPLTRREEQGDAKRDEFGCKRRDFLADGSYSSMSTVLSLFVYGKHIAMSTGSSGNLS